MDLPALRRLITCENRPLVECWWMLQQDDSPFTFSEAEKEPDPAFTTWVVPESPQAA